MLETNDSWRTRLGAVAGGILFIGLLHIVTPAEYVLWNTIFRHLYYLPIVIAALFFGWRGALAAAAFASFCYNLEVLISLIRGTAAGYSPRQAGEIVDFFVVGVVAGVFADRERSQKLALENTTRQLSAVYRELQDNFEQMKRSERLYAIGQLSAGLAHEVRTPLASIEGSAAILLEEPESRETREEFLHIIQKECRRLNRLLTNFLDFAKPRPPRYQAVDVGQLLGSVIDLAGHAIGQQPVVLRRSVSSSVPAIEGDPEQLKQVILNLTINAIQATPEGGEVELAARRQNGKVLIEVKDQGCGIRPEHLDKIFDPFFTTKDNGSGLGLSVAYQIVAQHGGLLTARSNPGQGMTFSVLLPLRNERVL